MYDMFLRVTAISLSHNFILESMCTVWKWSETSVYIRHWKVFLLLQNELVNISSISVVEFLVTLVYEWHKRMSMQHINKESGLSMFVKIHEVDIDMDIQ